MTAPRAIVRPDRRGEPDDVAIDGDRVRMERMAPGRWWLAIERGGRRVAFELRAKSRIACELVEDELGCRDDSGDPIPAAEVEAIVAKLRMDFERAESFRARVRAEFGIAGEPPDSHGARD